MDASEIEEINQIMEQYQQEASILKERNRAEQSEIREFWGDFLELFETYVLMSTASSIRFNDRFGMEAVDDVALQVLIRMHSKACQTALAISDLLHAGFADSANVCWRTLHEINVLARFIDKYSREQPEKKIAQRYLDHEFIYQFKHQCLVKRHKERLNIEPLGTDDFRKLKRKYEDLICSTKYGHKFKEHLGWAAPILKKRLSFEELEKRVGLDYWRPYYADVSAEVHTGPGSLFVRLGSRPHSFDERLTRPSKWGLSVPASNTAKTLLQITATVLLNREVTENEERLSVLNAFVEEIQLTSGQAEEALGHE